MPNFLDYLQQYEEAFQKSEVNKRNFEELPDGKYTVRVDRVELTQSKTTMKPQLVWEFVVTEGRYTGRKVWKYNGLDSEDKIGFLKNDLYQAGLSIDRLMKLEANLPKLLDRILEIGLKTKETLSFGKIQNVYINKLISNKKPSSAAAYTQNLDLPF